MRVKKNILNQEGQEGFSLPLTLLVGLIVTSSLMGAVYVAINSNQRTRFDFLRFLGRTGLDSLKTQYKALLNDTSEGNIYHYFWVSDGCSERTPKGECPTGVVPGEIQNPSTSFSKEFEMAADDGRQLTRAGTFSRRSLELQLTTAGTSSRRSLKLQLTTADVLSIEN